MYIVVEHCVINQLIWLRSIWRNPTEKKRTEYPFPKRKLTIIGTVAVRWGRVGRLKPSIAWANSTTGWCLHTARRGLTIVPWHRKSSIGNRMVTWLMTSRDPDRSRSWPQSAWIAGYWIVCCDAVRTVDYPSDSLASCYYIHVCCCNDPPVSLMIVYTCINPLTPTVAIWVQL